ncbi:MAG: MFS transporter [Acidobacteriota bacterium]
MRTRLGVMMFLQYAVWGAWAPVLWPYLTNELGFSQTEAGWIFSLLWIGCMLAPFTAGQIADRWVPTQWFLAAMHLAGGALLVALSRQTGRAFTPWLGLMGAYSLCYAPTLALTNSIAFHHVRQADFGHVRVWGTVGWIASGLVLSAWREGWLPPVGGCDSMLLAGVLSLALGVYCLTLPHTPPAREQVDPLAFRRAFVLLRDRNTLAFLAIAFVVTTELQFYYGPTAGFLETAVGVPHEAVPITMAVAQAAEIVCMAIALPIALRRLGLRRTLALGVVAWPLRYVVFALAPLVPIAIGKPAVIGSLALHGVGYTFFFVGSQIFMDRVSSKDIRASAQSLLTLGTLGLGNFLGTLFTAEVLARFTTGAETQWTSVFLVPCALTLGCAVAYLVLVRDPR